MLFIFDMGGVVTNTFLLTQLYNKLNITTEDFSFYAIELQLYKIGDNVKYKYNIVT